jgi:surfactin synthase thioesterase subunit
MISPDIELCPVQLPGREDRFSEPSFTRLEALVAELAQALAPYMETPFAFYGHSLGALVSFELTRTLRRQQRPLPIHLFVSGCVAPQLPATEPPIHQLPDEDFIQALRGLNGTPDAILQNAELMRVLLPLLRADFALYETYTYLPEEPLGLPISAYGGLEDSRAPRESVEAWRAQTAGKFVVRMYPGDHFFLHTKRNILLRGLRQDLTLE